MAMVVPLFVSDSQKTVARQDQSLLDKLLAQAGKKIPTPAERLQDAMRLFEESGPMPEETRGS